MLQFAWLLFVTASSFPRAQEQRTLQTVYIRCGFNCPPVFLLSLPPRLFHSATFHSNSLQLSVLYSVFGKSLRTSKRCWKWFPPASIQAWTRSIESEMSNNFSTLSLDVLPLRSASNTEPVSQNFSISLRNALRWGTGVSGNVSANFSCTKSVYLLPSRKTYSTRKTCFSIERTTVTKNWFNQLNSSTVLHFNRGLTAEYREMSQNVFDVILTVHRR